MKHLYSTFLLLCLFFFSNSFGQTFNKSNTIIQNSNNKKINLPPGAVLSKKFATNIDFSYKLNGGIPDIIYADSDLQVAKNLSAEELESLKDINPVNYNYYTTANSYFLNLSSKVKSIYNKTELWYIYVFDQDLKNKLVTIN